MMTSTVYLSIYIHDTLHIINITFCGVYAYNTHIDCSSITWPLHTLEYQIHKNH